MLPLLISLALIANCVVGQSHGRLISVSLENQTVNLSAQHCKLTCAPFQRLKAKCTVPHCGCDAQYLQTEGDCFVCKSQTHWEVAAVDLLLKAEIDQCKAEGFPVKFKYQFPPEDQAIIDQFDRDNADLQRNQAVFLTLQILGGQVGLVLAAGFATFSRRVSRDPTFLNFCLTWIFSSIAYSIPLYRGMEGNTVASSLGRVLPHMCLAQAALTNGAQVMTASSTMALVVRLWIKLRDAIHGGRSRRTIGRHSTTFLLLGLPYFLFLGFSISSVFIGRAQVAVDGMLFQRALPANFYCSVVETSTFQRLLYAMTIGLLLVATVFDGLIIFILYRHWRAFRHAENSKAVNLSTLSRIIGFSLYRVVVAIAYGFILNKPPLLMPQIGSGITRSVALGVPIWIDMLQATIPLVGFLVLGVNSEMLNSPVILWRRCKRTLWKVPLINTNSNHNVTES